MQAIRSQFHHVIDIAPTIYEIAGITVGDEVPGVEQQPIEGTSMCYTFDSPQAPGQHTEQYFEPLGNRAYYRDGWIASTRPEQLPWAAVQGDVPPEDYEWELYDLSGDFAQADDIAADHPDRLADSGRTSTPPRSATTSTRSAPSGPPGSRWATGPTSSTDGQR